MGVKKEVCDIFDAAYSAAGNIPRLTITGENEAYIENFISLEEYKKDTVKLKFKNSVIALFGQDFYIRAIKENCILVCGRIESIKFI